jgi:hypothetical protein
MSRLWNSGWFVHWLSEAADMDQMMYGSSHSLTAREFIHETAKRAHVSC